MLQLAGWLTSGPIQSRKVVVGAWSSLEQVIFKSGTIEGWCMEPNILWRDIKYRVFIYDNAYAVWERPYQHDSTASRPLSEVKHARARLVLRWGTTLESRVLFSFCAFAPSNYTFTNSSTNLRNPASTTRNNLFFVLLLTPLHQ